MEELAINLERLLNTEESADEVTLTQAQNDPYFPWEEGEESDMKVDEGEFSPYTQAFGARLFTFKVQITGTN